MSSFLVALVVSSRFGGFLRWAVCGLVAALVAFETGEAEAVFFEVRPQAEFALSAEAFLAGAVGVAL